MVLNHSSALELASAVVEFTDFASKLVSKDYQHDEDAESALAAHEENRTIVSNLAKRSRELDRCVQPLEEAPKALSNAELAFQEVTLKCKKIVGQSQKMSAVFRSKNGASGWRNLRLAFRRLWDEKERADLQKELDQALLRTVVLLLVLLNEVSFAFIENQTTGIAAIKHEQTQMEKNILSAFSINRSEATFEKQVSKLSKLLSKEKQFEATRLLEKWELENKSSIDLIITRLAQTISDAQRASNVKNHLNSLHFTQLGQRQRQISKAHAKTFRWVFEGNASSSLLWTDFRAWLRGPVPHDGLYWITGKPGAGKSTLMRYLCDEGETREHLKVWVGEKQLVIASCFFWDAGKGIQKSQVGLLRSLLHGILQQSPQLMPAVSPWRWRAYDLGASQVEDWSESELGNALLECLKAAEPESRICLFIDGLDEFEGSRENQDELINLLKHVSAFEHVKVCASSRPWGVFEDAFNQGSKLRLEDLTHDDIRRYVEDISQRNQHYQKARTTQVDACRDLEMKLVEKAQGVFFWVFLVLRLLLYEFQQEDTVSDLAKRLEGIPGGLDDYFKQSLTSIEEPCRADAANILRLTGDVQHKPPLMFMAFVNERDPDFAIKRTIQAVPDDEVVAMLENTAVDVKMCCKDFLGIYKMHRRKNVFNTYAVDFLHRTVKDFLRTDEVQEILNSYSTYRLDIDRYICNALLAYIKMLDLQTLTSTSSSGGEDLLDLSQQLMQYIKSKPPDSSETWSPSIIAEIDRTLTVHYTSTSPNFFKANKKSHDLDWLEETYTDMAMVSFAAYWDLTEFVTGAVKKEGAGRSLKLTSSSSSSSSGSSNKSRRQRPLLSYALGRKKVADHFRPPSPRIVAMILDNGGDPNESDPMSGQSAWESFLARAYATSQVEDWILGEKNVTGGEANLKSSMKVYAEVAELLISYGAARHLRGRDGSSYHAEEALRRAFGSEEGGRLVGFWDGKGKKKENKMREGQGEVKKSMLGLRRKLGGVLSQGNSKENVTK